MAVQQWLKRAPSRIAASFLLAVNAIAAQAAPPAQYPNAADSDPIKLGWMLGSPPPADRILRFEDGSYFRFPAMRWSVAHFRELMPTVNISRGLQPAAVLPQALRDDIDPLEFRRLDSGEKMSWSESLSANYTDGIVVLHKGRLIYERYFGALRQTASMAPCLSPSPSWEHWHPCLSRRGNWTPAAKSLTMCRNSPLRPSAARPCAR